MEYRAFHGRHDQPGSVLFPPPVQHSRYRVTVVTVFRALIAFLALLMMVLTIAGQLVPFCRSFNFRRSMEYSTWQFSVTAVRGPVTDRRVTPRRKNDGEKAFAVLSAILSVASCVLGFVYLGMWSVHERQRRREMHTYRNAQRYAQEMEMIDEAGGGGGHGNARTRASAAEYLRSYGSREELYRKERMRQRVDRSVGIALFSTLLVTTLCCLITVAVMAQFYNTQVAVRLKGKKGDGASYAAGMALFIAAMVFGVIAFVVLAMPFATGLYLCCPPSLEKVRTSPKLPRSDSEERAVHHAAAPVAYQQGYHNEVRFVAVQHGGSPRSSPAPAYAPYSPAEAHTMEPVRDEQMVFARDQDDHMAAPRTGGMTLQQYINNAPSTMPPPSPYAHRGASSPPPPELPQQQEQMYLSHQYQQQEQQQQQQQQPYVPTVVGVYPEALPGPTSMEHVTLHHVSSFGANAGVGATAPADLPSTQAAYRVGGGPVFGQAESGAQDGRRDSVSASKLAGLLDSPVKKR